MKVTSFLDFRCRFLSPPNFTKHHREHLAYWDTQEDSEKQLVACRAYY